MKDEIAPPLAAPQHKSGPRPLPLFLELVRRAGERDPELAAKALQGLKIYQTMPRHAAQQSRSIAARHEGVTLRDCGGRGAPILLVPSLINPPHVLDLDRRTSLAAALARCGHVLLLDWGPAASRAELSVADHVRERLLPLLGQVGEPAALVGYCLGGTMALAAARLAPVRGVATLAAPWHFAAYPAAAREALSRIWQDARPTAVQLGALPIEVLQLAFWSFDPGRVVAKFARLPDLDPEGEELRRFILLEDWANAGEPLPLSAARELIEDLFGRDFTGRGLWAGGGLPGCPLVHFTAQHDRIVPAATAAQGAQIACPAGHVGMVVGHGAGKHLHQPLRDWLARLPKQG